MYSCIIFLLTEGTARILTYSHNAEMSIEVHVASKESNEDPQILPRKVQSKASPSMSVDRAASVNKLVQGNSN